jgi:hypothetical protein
MKANYEKFNELEHPKKEREHISISTVLDGVEYVIDVESRGLIKLTITKVE